MGHCIPHLPQTRGALVGWQRRYLSTTAAAVRLGPVIGPVTN
jgi:hypothetical protein